jgi:Ca2+:H+ antiporter
LSYSGVALAIPTIFNRSVRDSGLTDSEIDQKSLDISRLISILLIVGYGFYVYFQAHTHHGIYDAIFRYDDHLDVDREEERVRPKLTLTETILALVMYVTL